MTLDIREFHTHFIAVKDVPDHDKWKQYFVSVIDKELSHQDKIAMKTSDRGSVMSWEQQRNSSTSYFNESSSINYDDFTDEVVRPVVSEVIEELNFNSYPVKFIDYWYNRYNKMGRHDVHNHPDSDLCLIYLLHLEEPNTTVFYNTMFDRSFLKKEMYTDDLKEGQIIIFPWHLMHEVQPQWSEKKRYTIAGNIVLDDKRES